MRRKQKWSIALSLVLVLILSFGSTIAAFADPGEDSQGNEENVSVVETSDTSEEPSTESNEESDLEESDSDESDSEENREESEGTSESDQSEDPNEEEKEVNEEEKEVNEEEKEVNEEEKEVNEEEKMLGTEEFTSNNVETLRQPKDLHPDLNQCEDYIKLEEGKDFNNGESGSIEIVNEELGINATFYYSTNSTDDTMSWWVEDEEDAESLLKVEVIYVKGGPAYKTHQYGEYTTEDNGLTAPINPNNNNNKVYGISYFAFCYTAEEKPVSVSPLQLTSVCSDERGQVKFRVTNLNEFAVDFTFENMDNGATGSGTAPAAEEGSESYTYFYVDASENSPNTTKMQWQDENEDLQSTTKASGNQTCQYEVTIEKSWMSAMEEPMEAAPEDVEWEVTITTSDGNEYTLNNENPSVTIWLDFDETFTITEEVPEGFIVFGTGTYSRDGDEETIAVYGNGPSWSFKGEDKYYGNEDYKGMTAVVQVINMEDPEEPADPEEPEEPEEEPEEEIEEETETTTTTTTTTGGGGGLTGTFAVPETIEIDDPVVPEGAPEPEVVIPEPVIPEGAPEPVEPAETIVLDEEPPLGAPELPQTGEGNPIYFYLAGLLLAGTGLAIRRTGKTARTL